LLKRDFANIKNKGGLKQKPYYPTTKQGKWLKMAKFEVFYIGLKL
jgi:hypothetical protein